MAANYAEISREGKENYAESGRGRFSKSFFRLNFPKFSKYWCQILINKNQQKKKKKKKKKK